MPTTGRPQMTEPGPSSTSHKLCAQSPYLRAKRERLAIFLSLLREKLITPYWDWYELPSIDHHLFFLLLSIPLRIPCSSFSIRFAGCSFWLPPLFTINPPPLPLSSFLQRVCPFCSPYTYVYAVDNDHCWISRTSVHVR